MTVLCDRSGPTYTHGTCVHSEQVIFQPSRLMSTYLTHHYYTAIQVSVTLIEPVHQINTRRPLIVSVRAIMRSTRYRQSGVSEFEGAEQIDRFHPPYCWLMVGNYVQLLVKTLVLFYHCFSYKHQACTDGVTILSDGDLQVPHNHQK